MIDEMTPGRQVQHTLSFNGHNVDTALADYIESISYTDVAAGSADSLSITLQNIDGIWLRDWYPQKGSAVSGGLIFKRWNDDGSDHILQCGILTLDDIRLNFNPKTAELSCVGMPASESFRTREHDQTWEWITIENIAREICGRYGLDLYYWASPIIIAKLEQSNDDSSFLMKLCEDYGLSMKIFRDRLFIYDTAGLEEFPSILTLKESDCEDISFTDGIFGTYTGARVSYKNIDSDEEISIYIGLQDENAEGSRVIKVNETCNSEAEARIKGAAQINKSKRGETTMSATIFPNPRITSGTCIDLDPNDFGRLSNRYFVDKVTWDVSSSGTKQQIEAHSVKAKVWP